MIRRIILIFLLIAVLGAVWWGWQRHSKKPDPSTSAPPPESVTTPGLSTYTNTTFGYRLTLPTTWIATPADFEEGSSSQKDSSINFAGDRLLFTLQADSKEKFKDLSLEQFARESLTPKDKITISEVVPQTIGDKKGIREKVETTDNTYSGLVYFTEDDKHFYSFYTYELAESAEVTTVLSTFRTTN